MPLAKVALVIIDGVGDITIPAFGNRTPLQVAHTPNLDALAAAGLNGLMDPVEPGLACGSDTAHMNLLGYDPRKHYRGRGAFESLGAGLSMAPGDIAFKSNFATLAPETGLVVTRRADRNFEHLGPLLCAALDGVRLPSFPQHTVSVRYATEHRCGVVVRGPGLTDAISGTDPLKDGLPLRRAQPLDGTPEAHHTAAVVNELSDCLRGVLEAHPANAQRAQQGLNPANVVLLRGCGSRIRVPEFQEVHGMRACLVAPTKIIAGLGMSFGIEPLEAPGARGDYFSALHAKSAAIAAALIGGGYEFGLLHVKAVDDTGHDRLAVMKVKFLEAVDAMVGQLVARLAASAAATTAEGYAVCVTADHSTPVLFGDHSHEPVPLAIAHVADIVASMGGAGQAALRRPGEAIPMPNTLTPPPMAELLRQAAQQDARRAAAADGVAFPDVRDPPEQRRRQQPGASGSGGGRGGGGAAADVGTWPEAWPLAVYGDRVSAFDELSAGAGCLGRFTGSELMPLIKQFRATAPFAG